MKTSSLANVSLFVSAAFLAAAAHAANWQKVDNVWDGYFGDARHWSSPFAQNGAYNTISTSTLGSGTGTVTVNEATNITGAVYLDAMSDRPAVLDVRGSSLCFATQTVESAAWPKGPLYGRFNGNGTATTLFYSGSDDSRWNKQAQLLITNAAAKISSPESGVVEFRLIGGTGGGVFDMVHPDPRRDTMSDTGSRPTVQFALSDYYTRSKSDYNTCRLALENTTAYFPSINLYNYPTVTEITLSNSTYYSCGNINMLCVTNVFKLAAGSVFAMSKGGWSTMCADNGIVRFEIDSDSRIEPVNFTTLNGNRRLEVEGGRVEIATANAFEACGTSTIELSRTIVNRSAEAKIALSDSARLIATDCAFTNGTKFTTKTTGDAKVELYGGTLSTPLMAGGDSSQIALSNVTVSVGNWGLANSHVTMTDCLLASDSTFKMTGLGGEYVLSNVTGSTSLETTATIDGTNVVTFTADSLEKKLIVNSSGHIMLSGNVSASGPSEVTLNVEGGTLEFRGSSAASRLNLAHNGSSNVGTLNVRGGRLVSKVAKDGVTRGFGLGITHGTGFINVSGGELDVSGLCICTEANADAAESVFRQTGGVVKVAPGNLESTTMSVGLCGSGNKGDSRQSRIALDGGITEVNQISGGEFDGYSGTGSVCFEANGGTVRVNGSNANILRNFSEAKLGEKGLVIDSAGYGATVAQDLTSQEDVTGRLVLVGAGVKTISGSSSVLIVAAEDSTVFAANADNSNVDLVVTNNAQVAFEADGESNRSFKSIVLGDNDTYAVLNLSAGDALEVSGDVTVNNLRLVLSGSFTTGSDYSLLTCGGTVSAASQEAWRRALALGLSSDQGCDLVCESDGEGRQVLKMKVRAKKSITLAVDANTTSNATEDVIFAATDELTADVGERGTLNMTGYAAHGSLTKTGEGRAIFGNAANFLIGGVCVRSGLLAFPYASVFASESLVLTTLTVGTGTLELGSDGAEPVEVATKLKLNTASASDAAVIKASSDVSIAAPTVTQGCLVKRGAGTLTLNTSGSCAFSNNAGKDEKNTGPRCAALEFDDFGTPPTNNYSSLTVAEGDLVLKGTSQAQYTVSGSGAVYVGMPVQGISKPARLVVDGANAVFSGSHFHVGSGVRSSNCSHPNPEFIVTNGANVSVTSLNIGWNGNDTAQPMIRVCGEGSVLSASEYVYLSKTQTKASTEENPMLLVSGGAQLRLPNWYDSNTYRALVLSWNNACAVFDGSTLSDAKGIQGKIRFGSTNSKLVFRNGSVCRVGEIRIESDSATPEMIFDNSTWSLGTTNALILTRPERMTLTARNKGIIFEPNASTNITFGLVVSGSGDLVKRGTGTLTLSAVPTLTGVCRIEEGSFALADGLVADGIAFAGAGNLASGTFNDSTIVAPLGDDGTITNDVPVLSGATLTGTTLVDLARTTEIADPLPENVKVMTYTGATPDVSGWRITNKGGTMVGADFTAANGEIRMTIRRRGAVLIVR